LTTGFCYLSTMNDLGDDPALAATARRRLRGLQQVGRGAPVRDPRADDALDLLVRRRRADGCRQPGGY
jgi:hypothetical protein